MAYPDIEELLRKFKERELKRLVAPDVERSLSYLVEKMESETRQDRLAQAALATHGISLFRERNAREGLFGLLSDDELNDVYSNLTTKTPRPKRGDNAFELSGLPWTAGAAIVDFIESRFEIPSSFLPHHALGNPKVEILEPVQQLPPLYPHQEDVCAQIEGIFRSESGRFLVQMPTGSGKTRTMVDALANCWIDALGRGCIIWLAHSEELCEQAAGTIRQVWCARAKEPAKLVRLFGNHEPNPIDVAGAIVVASLQKVYQRIQSGAPITKFMRNRAHAVVFDEAHRALAPSFLSVIEFLTEKGAPLAGLSATPGRGVVDREQENKDLASIFDERLVEPSSEGEIFADLQDQGILAVVRRREVETGVEISPSEKDFQDAHLGFEYGRVVLAALAKNLKRNNLIIETVLEEIQDNRPVLLFACSVSHAQILAAALNLHGVSSACVHGEMARLDRSHVVEGFRAGKFDVLTNFGVLTTGFDAPRTRTVIVARPTSSAVLYAQMIGRALRGPKMGGGEEAWVVDVRDNLERFGAVTTVYQAFERFWGK